MEGTDNRYGGMEVWRKKVFWHPMSCTENSGNFRVDQNSRKSIILMKKGRGNTEGGMEVWRYGGMEEKSILAPYELHRK